MKEEKKIALYPEESNTSKVISGNHVPPLSLKNKPMAVHRKLQKNSTREGYNCRKFEKYHETERVCPLLDDSQLYLDIGVFGEGTQVEAILDGKYVCQNQ